MSAHDEFDDIVENPNYVGKHRAGTNRPIAAGTGMSLSDVPAQDMKLYKIGAAALALGILLFGGSKIVEYTKANNQAKTDSQDVAAAEKAPTPSASALSSTAVDKAQVTGLTVFDAGDGSQGPIAAQKLTADGYKVGFEGPYPDMNNVFPNGVFYTSPDLLPQATEIANQFGVQPTQSDYFPQDVTVIVGGAQTAGSPGVVLPGSAAAAVAADTSSSDDGTGTAATQ